MPDGRFLVEMVRGVPVVAAPEEIDICNAPELDAALLQAAAAADGAATLVADMTGTLFCDSAGVHVLAAAHKRAQAEDGELLLVVSSAAVLRVFAINGIDRVIPNFMSLDDALAHASLRCLASSDLARYRLGRHVGLETFRTAFAADAAALDAAEGGVRCHPGEVDADAARLDPAGNVEAVLHVTGTPGCSNT